MIGVTEPPFTCTRCGYVEMTLTAISQHELGCRVAGKGPATKLKVAFEPENDNAQVSERPCSRDSWFELRVKFFMMMLSLENARRNRRNGKL